MQTKWPTNAGTQVWVPSPSERLQSPSISSFLSRSGFSRWQNFLWFSQVANFLWFFQVAKFFDHLSIWSLVQNFVLYIQVHYSLLPFFVIYSVGARIHSWLGGLLCSPKRGAFSWSDCFDLLCIDLFICVDLLCLDLLWLTLCWFGWWLKIDDLATLQTVPCKGRPVWGNQDGAARHGGWIVQHFD